MATIYFFEEFTNGIPTGAPSYLTSADGYLHIFNYGPQILYANYTSTTSPVAPAENTGGGIPIKPSEWTLVPADTSGGSERIAFAVAADQQRSLSWSGMHIWTV
jgi:hypothetical protein